MAELDFFGADGLEGSLMDALTNIEIDCPECNKTFEISLDSINSQVTCPHCQTQIEIESE